MTKTRTSKLKVIKFDTNSTNYTVADRFGSSNLFNLHEIIEALESVDGKLAVPLGARVHLRAYSRDPFWIVPVVVQTAGTWSDTFDINDPRIRKILDDSIDDVFGYKDLPGSIAKRVPTSDPTVATGSLFGVQRTIEIPQNFINILRKEVETERLQDLLIGIVSYVHDPDKEINWDAFLEIDYYVRSKEIVLR